MSGLLASLALIGGLIAVVAILLGLGWFALYFLSRRGAI
jgi:hypothetical protein